MSLETSTTTTPGGGKSFFKHEPGQTYTETKASAISGLMFYSFLMFTLPLIVFFGLQQYIEDNFEEMGAPWNILWPALAAVVTVNCIIVMYVLKAFREEQKEAAREGEEKKND